MLTFERRELTDYYICRWLEYFGTIQFKSSVVAVGESPDRSGNSTHFKCFLNRVIKLNYSQVNFGVHPFFKVSIEDGNITLSEGELGLPDEQLYYYHREHPVSRFRRSH